MEIPGGWLTLATRSGIPSRYATHRELAAGDEGKVVDVAKHQSSLDLPDFTGCPGSDEFVVVAEALLPGSMIYEP